MVRVRAVRHVMMIRAKIAQLAKLAALALPFAGALPAQAADQPVSGWGLLNMTEGVTDISRKIYSLHMEIFWI